MVTNRRTNKVQCYAENYSLSFARLYDSFFQFKKYSTQPNSNILPMLLNFCVMVNSQLKICFERSLVIHFGRQCEWQYPVWKRLKMTAAMWDKYTNFEFNMNCFLCYYYIIHLSQIGGRGGGGCLCRTFSHAKQTFSQGAEACNYFKVILPWFNSSVERWTEWDNNFSSITKNKLLGFAND